MNLPIALNKSERHPDPAAREAIGGDKQSTHVILHDAGAAAAAGLSHAKGAPRQTDTTAGQL